MSVNSVNADGSLTKIAGSGSTDTSVLKGDFSVVESTSTATRAYSIGDCFIMETGQLVRATSAIAIGDTIAIGTNVAATSVVQLLGAKIDTSQKGANNGIAELDSSGKVPTTQLPSYVDDVVNGYLYNGAFYYDDQHTEPITPEDDKIYVDKTENKTYRWGGESYVEVGGGGVALGETSTTAYRGDRGKTAYDHSQDSGRVTTATASGFYKIASTSEGHIAGLTAVQKSDITALGIPAQDTTYGVVDKTTNGLCPVLPNETTTTKYLRQDGSWQVPPNTTYTVATGDNNGQIKVTPSSGSAYNVGVKGLGTAAYANLANTVFEVGKASSRSTATVGTWTAMCHSSQAGSPTLPTAGKWWNVMSLNNWSDSSTNWVSQLAVATQDTLSGVWWRANNAAGTSIDSSTWHRLAEGDSSGNANNALKINGITLSLVN